MSRFLIVLAALVWIAILPSFVFGENYNISKLYDALPNTGEIRDAKVSGDYVFMATSNYNLYVVDVSNPLLPFCANFQNVPNAGEAVAIEVVGDFVYLFHSQNRVSILDIIVPYEPELIGSFVYGGQYLAHKRNGNDLFITDNSPNLYCYDISNPSVPILRDTLPLSVESNSLSPIGSYVILQATPGTARMVNISNPDSLFDAGTITLGPNAKPLLVKDNLLICIAYGQAQIYDLAQPLLPILLSTFYPLNYWYGEVVAVDSFLVFSGHNNDGYPSPYEVSVYEISDPALPVYVGPGNLCSNNYVIYLTGYNNQLLVLMNGKLQMYNCQPGSVPQLSLSYEQGVTYAAEVSDTHLFTWTPDQLKIFSLNGVGLPSLISSTHIHSVKELKYANDLLLVGSAIRGIEDSWMFPKLDIWDVSNPLLPDNLATYSYSTLTDSGYGYPCDMEVYDDYLFASNDYNNFTLVDLSFPESPQHVSHFTGHVDYFCAARKDNLLLLGCYDQDISPSLIRSVLRIYEISNPATPVFVADLPLGFFCWDIQVKGNYALLVGNISGLVVIDISNPVAPVQVSGYAFAENGREIYLHNDAAVVLTSSALRVLDISNPAQINQTGLFELNQTGDYDNWDLSFNNHTAYLALGNTVSAFNCQLAIDATSNHDPFMPAPIVILQNYPNPFNPGTTIQFSLPKTGQAGISIYNTKGQVIKEVTHQSYPAGENSWFWDGKDSKGKDVPSGVYLLKVKTDDSQAVKKLTLVK